MTASMEIPLGPRRRLLAFCGLYLAAGALLFFGATAHPEGEQTSDEVRFRITNPRLARYRIAVPVAAGDAETGRLVREVLSDDLSLSGLFQSLDPAAFLPEGGDPLGIDPAVWRTVGAEGVIKAQATLSGGSLAMEFRLYEVVKGNSPVLVRYYHGPPAQARHLGHLFAAAVLKFFTNEDSFFGTQIALCQDSGPAADITVMNWDGTEGRRVVHNGSKNILPSWHPSGGSLLYTSFQRGAPEVFAIPIGGGKERLVSGRKGLNLGGVYSPDGTQIALTLSQDGNSDIYLLTPAGDIVKRLTESPGIDTSPTWSPDGTQIGFVSNRHGNPQIWMMARSGAGQTKLTRAGKYNQEPAWAPKAVTGQSLILFSGRDEKGVYDLFTVNTENQQIVRLTENRGSNVHPTWAPTARTFAFESSRGGIWVATADGKTEKQVLKQSARAPSWGPLVVSTRSAY